MAEPSRAIVADALLVTPGLSDGHSFHGRTVSFVVLAFALFACLSGCGGREAANGPSSTNNDASTGIPANKKPVASKRPIKNAFAEPSTTANQTPTPTDSTAKKNAANNKPAAKKPRPADDPNGDAAKSGLANGGSATTKLNPPPDRGAPSDIRPAKSRLDIRPLRMAAPLSTAEAGALGIRRLDGKHLILYTDLPPHPSVDELPKVFDLAMPKICDYFQTPRQEAEKFRLVGSLMIDKQKFIRAKLLPRQMPAFLHGFQQGGELWLYDQPTVYYRRHLLLHEGVHGFMNWRFGGCGPPWYMEGMAELLSTHRWQNGQLDIAYSPRSKDEAPHWGRVRIIRDDYQAGRGLMVDNVFAYGPRAHLKVEPYGWSWAAAHFFDRHPAYQDAFRRMTQHAHDNGPFFNEQFVHLLGDSRAKLDIEWQVFVNDIQYGHDIARAAIDFRPSQPLAAEGATIDVLAERGWQSSGVTLKAGQQYRIVASGQFQIAKDSEPWISEANGVTIRYHRDQPLGRLLGAVETWDQRHSRPTHLVNPISLGDNAVLTPKSDGDLFLQLNDSPAERADNSGAVQVRIEVVE